jgi:hypothetical protein
MMCACIKKVLRGWVFSGRCVMFCLLEDFVQKMRRDCKMDEWIAGLLREFNSSLFLIIIVI